MRSRSSAVRRLIFARLNSVNEIVLLPVHVSLTDSETKLGLVWDLDQVFPVRVALCEQHQDGLALRTRSLRIEFVDA